MKSEAGKRGASLQDTFAPNGICFGCGPANPQGLRIKSFKEGEWLVAAWRPEDHHQAFPGMLNGGIIGALLDCQSNWAAAMHLKEKNGWEEIHATVTADYHVELLAPTPAGEMVDVRARVVDASERRATVEAELRSGAVLTARCRGNFVAVKPGHPAYHRWG